MEEYISVQPISGIGDKQPHTVQISIQPLQEDSINDGYVPRQGSILVKTKNQQKIVTIKQKGNCIRTPVFSQPELDSNQTYKTFCGTDSYNIPEPVREQIVWCIDKLYLRFGGFIGTSRKAIVPGDVNIFSSDDDPDYKMKIIYHGDSTKEHIFGDTTQEDVLTMQNYVEFDFTEINENLTKAFKPILIIITNNEPNIQYYIQFGTKVGDEEIQWFSKQPLRFPAI